MDQKFCRAVDNRTGKLSFTVGNNEPVETVCACVKHLDKLIMISFPLPYKRKLLGTFLTKDNDRNA